MRDYFGLINGTIPKCVTVELPFTDMCCKFMGYMPRFSKCGCCVYETDGFDNYILNTDCSSSIQSNHDTIEYDTSFARWSVHPSNIQQIKDKITVIEATIPINSYVYYATDEIADFSYCDNNDIQMISDEVRYNIFKWVVLTSILRAFHRYNITTYNLVFTSECI